VIEQNSLLPIRRFPIPQEGEFSFLWSSPLCENDPFFFLARKQVIPLFFFLLRTITTMNASSFFFDHLLLLWLPKWAFFLGSPIGQRLFFFDTRAWRIPSLFLLLIEKKSFSLLFPGDKPMGFFFRSSARLLFFFEFAGLLLAKTSFLRDPPPRRLRLFPSTVLVSVRWNFFLFYARSPSTGSFLIPWGAVCTSVPSHI